MRVGAHVQVSEQVPRAMSRTLHCAAWTWLGATPGTRSLPPLRQAAQKAAEDTPAGTPQPPARGRRNSGSELELGLDGGAGEARRRGAAAQEVELEPPGPGLDGAELHAPNRMQLASRDRRTSDAAV